MNNSSFTKNQKDEVSKGKRYEVVVHGRVEALAASDDDANKDVADDSAEEDDHVEDGHQHKTHLDMLTYGQVDKLRQSYVDIMTHPFLHLPRAKNRLDER